MSQAGVAANCIPDDAGLLRRIHPDWVVWDKNVGNWRVSSAAFKDPAMSVDVEPLLNQMGLDWSFCLRHHPDHSLVRVNAGMARALGQMVVLNPVPDNDVHAEVRGKKTQGVSNRLLKAAEVVLLQPKSRTV